MGTCGCPWVERRLRMTTVEPSRRAAPSGGPDDHVTTRFPSPPGLIWMLGK